MSAGDLNETVISQIDDEMICVGEINQTLEEICADEISESENSEILSANFDSKDCGEIQNCADNSEIEEEIVSYSNEDILSEKDNGTFTALQVKINNAGVNSTVTLENDYSYDAGFNVNGIVISKSLTIDGNGKTIDAKGQSRIFNLEPGINVIFKNLILKNAYTEGEGGTIYAYRINLTVENTTFTNNQARIGGAIYANESNIILNHDRFLKNQAVSSGGSILARRSNVDISNTLFEDSHAGGGGSLQVLANGKLDVTGKFENNTFKNSTATYTAGFFYISIPTTVINCTFENYGGEEYGGLVSENNLNITNSRFKNSYGALGGAVSIGGDKNLIVNCTFENNHAQHGGAIYSNTQLTISNCHFESNNAENGGAIYNIADYSSISSCTFKICNATGEGGAVYNSGNNLNILSCDFINCYTNTYLYKTTQDSSIRNTGNNLIVNDCIFIDEGTFTALQVRINKAVENSTFSLENDYSYDVGFNVNGITISKSLTIDGNGKTIDAKGQARIFNIEHGINVIFKNLILKNAYSEGEGGTIYANNVNLTVENTTFTNSLARIGGAIYANESNIILNHDRFLKNQAVSSGGSILARRSNVDISNTLFEDSHAGGGGSLQILASGKEDVKGKFENNTFKNSTATYTAGFFYTSIPTTVLNCTFENYDGGEYGALVSENDLNIINSRFKKSYGMLGGAVNIGGDKNLIVNCTFENNHAQHGGAIYSNTQLTISNCRFVSNNAEYNGGAVYDGFALNCTFINNSAYSGGAVYFSKEGSVVGCSFVDNSAQNNSGAVYGGSALNCSFVNNSANYGGAVYFINDGSVVGCSFVNNSANYGGAVYFIKEGSVVNCSFVGNSADYGGAMSGSSYSALNCSFAGNSARNNGGAMSGSSYSARICTFVNNSANYGGAMADGSALNCSFINNSAAYGGGAMSNYGSALNCTFINNSADYGGAMYYGSAVRCSFAGNSANEGGAMYGGSALNCSFVNNSAKKEGGAMSGSSCSAVNCTFVNNYVQGVFNSHGGAICWGSAVNCTFNQSGVNFLYGTSNILDCIFKQYPNVEYHYTSYMKVDDLRIIKGKTSFLVAYLYDVRGPLVNKTVIYNVEGNRYTVVTTSGGLARFIISDYLTEGGNYIVPVSYAGDSINYAVSKSVNVTVQLRSDSFISVENLTLFVGEEGYLTVNLYSSDGKLSNKTVTFTINDADYNQTTDLNGTVKFRITDYLTAYGTYYIAISFEGDDYFYPASAVAKFIINRYDSTLKVNNISLFVDEDGYLIANLSDVRGPLVNKTVIFSRSNVDCNVSTDLDGLAKIKISDYLDGESLNIYDPVTNEAKKLIPAGNYYICIYFQGDEYDNPSSKNTTIVIKKYDSVLNVDDLEIFKDESDILVANLSDSRGPLVNKTVIFKFGNIKLGSITTDLNGSASLNVSDYFYDEGVYFIDVVFEGDESDNPVSANASVILKKYDSFLNVNNLSIVLDEEGILVANLSDNKGPIPGKTVIFTVNGHDTSKITSSVGLASFKITGSEIGFGKHSVTVSFAGDNKDRPVSVNATVVVSSYKGNLTVTQSGKYYGDTVLTFKLADLKTNVSIPFVFIRMVFSNGKSELLSTDANGLLVYQVPFEPGNYSYTAAVTSDYADVNIVNVDNLEIHKLTGEIQLSHENESKTLVIKLVNPQNGDVYRKVNVHLQFSNGEDEDVVTNDLGMVVYDMPFTPGTYNVTAYVDGEYREFEIAELNNMVISSKDNSEVSFDGDIVFDFLKSGRTRVSVVNGVVLESGISVSGHPEAVIHLEGDYIVVSNLSAGDYNLRVVTTPNEGYNSVIGVHPIKVNRIYPLVEFSKNIEFDYLGSDYTVVQITGGSIGNVSIDGNPKGAVINVTGNNITVSGLDAGPYTLRVTVSPDNDHKVAEFSENIYVRKINSKVDISDITFKYGQSGYVTVNVEGGTIVQSNIKIIGYDSIVPKLEGNIITLSGLNAGTYRLSVTSTPDKNHYQVTSYAAVAVEKVKSSVELSGDITFNYLGSGSAFVVVNGGSVGKVSIDGNPKEAKISFKNNVVRVSGLNAGTYKLRVKSTPDKNHLAGEDVKTIKVNKIASTISFSSKKIVFKYLGSGSTNVMVGGGKVLKSGLKIVGSKVKPTIKKNKITVSGLKVGTYTLKVTLTPDGNHYAPKSSSTIKITVKKASAKIKVKKISTVYKKGKVWKIKLLNPKNKGIGKTEIKLKIYTGKKFITKKVKTNSKGVAKFKVPSKMSLGKHKVVLTMSKNKYYAGKSVTSYITVNPIKLSFEVTSKYQYSGSMVSVWVKNKKAPANNIKVKMLVYTGNKVTKKFTLVTGNYKSYKGFVGYGTNALSVGKHNVIVKPISKIYSGSGKTTMVIQKGANKYGTGYSLVSKGKLTLH